MGDGDRAVLVLTGLAASAFAVAHWGSRDFGAYDPELAMRLVVPSVVLLALGAQTIFSSFFLRLLGMGVDGETPQVFSRAAQEMTDDVAAGR